MNDRTNKQIGRDRGKPAVWAAISHAGSHWLNIRWFVLAFGSLGVVLLGCAVWSPKVEKTETPRSDTADSKPVFEVEIKELDGVRVCNVTFSGKLPSPLVVDKILRETFEKAVKENPKKDGLAYAYLGDDELTSNQYSGDLVYKASKKKIMTRDEYDGVKTSTTDTSSYFVQTEEQHTYPGVKPKRRWLSITLVYPKAPTQEEVYEAIIEEIEKVASRGLDVNAYASVGDKAMKTSWHQIRDSDGAYVFAEYENDTRQIKRKGKLLRTL